MILPVIVFGRWRIRSRCSFCASLMNMRRPYSPKRVLMSATNDSSQSFAAFMRALSNSLKLLLVVEVLHALAHIIISFSIVRSVLMMTGWRASHSAYLA